jgi:AcrR family transcriptional regulator
MCAVLSTRSEFSAVARHIARVAARLFAARGYDATSVREIVEAAGVTKPTLYYHFGSKEGLAQALLTQPLAQLVETMRGVLDREGDPIVALEALVEAQFAFCREEPDRIRFFYAVCFGPLASELATELARFGEVLIELMVQAVRRAADAGLVDAARIPACVAALRGLIVFSSMEFLFHGVALGPDLAHRIVHDLLRGFGGPAWRPARRLDRGHRL